MKKKWYFLVVGLLAIIIAIVMLSKGEKELMLDFEVIHKETKQPMSGVELSISVDNSTRKDITNEEGRCRIIFDKEEASYVGIRVRKEGFVPVDLRWYDVIIRTGIPKKYTLEIEQGTSIGGFILNEKGRPIEGATVYLLVHGTDETKSIAINDQKETTDINGQWRCDIVPSEIEDISIRLAHPDYISDEMYGVPPTPPIEELRNRTAIMVMKKGLSVSGKVVDTRGLPIEGALVAQGSDRFGSNYPKTKTDSEGWFTLKNAKPGGMVLTVQASGYSPDVKQVTVYAGMNSIEFRIDSGHTIKGRIIDSEGKPIAGAFVVADSWQGYRSLEWRVNTNAEGRFQWNDAPSDEVLFDMGETGYMYVRKYPMSPSYEEYVITMYPPLRVSGKVVDADTGERIDNFKLIHGIKWEDNDNIYWDRREIQTFTQGRYEINITQPHKGGHLVQIEVDGYMPAVSRIFKDDEGEVILNFKLKKGTGPTGIVKLPNGKPAVDAKVLLSTASQPVYFQNGRTQTEPTFTKTDANGQFSLPAQTESYLLSISHDEGYAEITDKEFATSSEIKIEPWGKIKGVLYIGSKPGAGETISIFYSYSKAFEAKLPYVSHTYTAATDTDGHFTLNRVAPGKAKIGREIRINMGGGAYTSTLANSIPVEVKAGQTVTIQIGGTGRPVVGKVEIPKEYRGADNWTFNFGILIPGHNFIVNPDGTFRIEDVPAGKYKLQINMSEASAPTQPPGKPIGWVMHEFEVPKMPGGRSDEPLDIGTLKIEMMKD